MRLRLNDKTIYALAALNALVLIFTKKVILAEDSESYLDAWQNSLSMGFIDFARTPSYPIILGCLQAIAGQHFTILCVVVQHLVFLLSVWFFRKITSLILSSVTMGRWLTLFYALFPFITFWANRILTESFAISGSVFLFYHLIRFSYSPTWKHVLGSTIWFIFLIFLRPAFLYLLPIGLLAWLMFWNRKPWMAACGMLGILMVSLLEYEYCKKYEEQFGIFAPSHVSVVNFTYLAFKDGLMKPEYSDDSAFRSFIENYDGSEPISYCPVPTIQQYGLATVHRALRASQQDQTSRWIRNALYRFIEAAEIHFSNSRSPIGIAANCFKLLFNFVTLYLFLILFLVILLHKTIRFRKLYPIATLLLLATLGNLCTAIIGAQGEWLRLISPSLPLLLLMIGFLMDEIRQTLRRQGKLSF